MVITGDSLMCDTNLNPLRFRIFSPLINTSILDKSVTSFFSPILITISVTGSFIPFITSPPFCLLYRISVCLINIILTIYSPPFSSPLSAKSIGFTPDFLFNKYCFIIIKILILHIHGFIICAQPIIIHMKGGNIYENVS